MAKAHKNRVALVTGGSRGIGRAICLRLVQEADVVVVNYRRREDAAMSVAHEIEAAGARPMIVQADVSDSADVTQMVAAVAEKWGRIDILVNNAGGNVSRPLVETTDAQWRELTDTHLSGTFYCCREAGRLMLEQEHGAIVNIASMMGLMGFADIAPYCAAKAGVIGLTKALAKEWGGNGIRVNSIAPGFIETDLISDAPEETRKWFAGQSVLGRVGTVEDVASLVGYLVSEQAGFITGTCLNVSGGALI